MDTPARTPSPTGSESLPLEPRTPMVPKALLGVSSPASSLVEAGESLTVEPDGAGRGNESLPELRTDVLSAHRAAELPRLASQEHVLVEEDQESMPRFRPVASSTSTLRYEIMFHGPSEEWQVEVAEATAHTFEAIDAYLEYRAEVRRLDPETLKATGRRLRRFYSTPLIDDPLLGCVRPVTLSEFLGRDSGTRIAIHIARELFALHEGAAIDLLRTVRPFARWVCLSGAELPSGVNLRERYGPLVCPIGDRDLPRRTPKSEVFLPDFERMIDIFEETISWARGRTRCQAHAFRTAAITTTCFETGMRGAEARALCLDDQLFRRDAGIADLRNPVNVRSAKNAPPRQVVVNPYGWSFLLYWLEHWRPTFSSELEGFVFPSSGGSELASSSLSETTSQLLAHLKNRGLLHETFTFHATRKTYATHYLERLDVDVDALLAQCGWSSGAQLGTYVRPSATSRQAAQDRFARTLGSRGGTR